MAQQKADALTLVAEAAMHHEPDPGASGTRYHVIIHIDGPVLADPSQPGQSALEDGAGVSEEPDPVDLPLRLRLSGERRGEERGSTSKERAPIHHSIT